MNELWRVRCKIPRCMSLHRLLNKQNYSYYSDQDATSAYRYNKVEGEDRGKRVTPPQLSRLLGPHLQNNNTTGFGPQAPSPPQKFIKSISCKGLLDFGFFFGPFPLYFPRKADKKEKKTQIFGGERWGSDIGSETKI